MAPTLAAVAAVLETAVWTRGNLQTPSGSIPSHTVPPQRVPSTVRRTWSLYRGRYERRRDGR